MEHAHIRVKRQSGTPEGTVYDRKGKESRSSVSTEADYPFFGTMKDNSFSLRMDAESLG